MQSTNTLRQDIFGDVSSKDSTASTSAHAAARPIDRLFAKLIDIFIFGYLNYFWYAFLFMFIDAEGTSGALLYYVYLAAILLGFPFIEAYCITKFSTTPGKWLLGIYISSIGNSPITFKQSLGRSIKAWTIGAAFILSDGFYVIMLLLPQFFWVLAIFSIGAVLGMFGYRYTLLKDKNIFWDNKAKVSVKSSEPRRRFAARIIVIFLLALGVSIGMNDAQVAADAARAELEANIMAAAQAS